LVVGSSEYRFENEKSLAINSYEVSNSKVRLISTPGSLHEIDVEYNNEDDFYLKKGEVIMILFWEDLKLLLQI